MGWSFRRSVKIAPGIRLNFSKSGISTSIGVKGLTYNTRGRVTASIPGTGIRFTQQLHSQRTSRPISSVVAGSSRIDSANTERLSKREQATLDFVLMVQNRTSAALVRYFISHGVHVVADDLSEAVTLEEHQTFLGTLSREFEVTTKAVVVSRLGKACFESSKKSATVCRPSSTHQYALSPRRSVTAHYRD
ncbi:DUF4236 domain-containing protein [Ralstonia solanacearum]|uniref:DUF4236 domain-containing protein n=1 Tax=Ralstonia solanacearum TaxID=305 RepID=UPI001E47D373|nr:DUF4236 domain-containing protein [Ralstonia solanacearum]